MMTAKIYGEPYIELPHDLYIPPDALEVVLEAFEGPLDLLLYLIRKENLDILDIPMAPLTRQYLEYVEIMRTKNLELAAEYRVMAAMLMEIKSRLLLPRPQAVAAAEDLAAWRRRDGGRRSRRWCGAARGATWRGGLRPSHVCLSHLVQ